MTQNKWTAEILSHQSEAEKLCELIAEADAVVVGIGAGMSAADGFLYSGERFTQHFADFIEKYGLIDMLQASLYDYESITEYWAFQSRFIALNYLDQPVGPSYLALKSLLVDKPYHIITTNADNAFWVADYDPEKVFHIQGEYGLMQCSQFCHAQTYRKDDLIRQMVTEQSEMTIPYELIPYCPRCGAYLEVNKRNAEKGMVEDADFYAQLERYEAFLAQYETGQVLYLEIGVGFTTPQFIKQPFTDRTESNPAAIYVPMNQKRYRLPQAIRQRTIRLTDDIQQTLTQANQIKGEK
ncbi:NAD-dependent deacetylase [Dolosigranulum pigrum]|uniref:SIR2 family NAD-dependent protein deacylase n=1 Tax=Dolosigranulum pigrum TaxID=29394 RepID=UPI001AD87434|nr:NAD-dependent deacetylase [Dolosigranulum pigrum]QTJ40838.1 NAD-dependent deacetylase [Dolosigranulum pigrum]